MISKLAPMVSQDQLLVEKSVLTFIARNGRLCSKIALRVLVQSEVYREGIST